MKQFILQPGKICTFDKSNLLNQNENGVIFVEIVKEIPKKKLFGPRWFKIKGTGDDECKMPDPIEVPETLLSPEGMAVIRYPSNIPVINNMDVWAIDRVLEYIHRPKSDFIDNSDKERSIDHRLKALREKLKYYLKINEV